MQAIEIMSTKVKLASPEDTLEDIAKSMSDIDSGALPVGENDRLVGMITDRDIVVRALGAGQDPHTTTVRDVMSKGIHYCFEDEDLKDVVKHMAEWKVRRLPVLNENKRLTGIISLGDIARNMALEQSGSALREISL